MYVNKPCLSLNVSLNIKIYVDIRGLVLSFMIGKRSVGFINLSEI